MIGLGIDLASSIGAHYKSHIYYVVYDGAQVQLGGYIAYSSRCRPSDNFSQLCYGFQAEIPSSHAISSCTNQEVLLQHIYP